MVLRNPGTAKEKPRNPRISWRENQNPFPKPQPWSQETYIFLLIYIGETMLKELYTGRFLRGSLMVSL